MKHWLHAFRLRTLPLAVSSILVGCAIASLSSLAGCGHPDGPRASHTQEDVRNADVHILTLVPLRDTFHVDGYWYQLMDDDEHHVHVVSEQDTALLSSSDGIHALSIRVEDLNEDGAVDICIPFISNTPGQEEWYLFDRSRRGFALLENATDLYAAERLPGTSLYISYNRSGCADLNWESHLFGIEDHAAFLLGHMDGRLCPRELSPAILTYRVSDPRRIERMDSIPGDTSQAFTRNKADVIRRYWAKNHERFLRHQ